MVSGPARRELRFPAASYVRCCASCLFWSSNRYAVLNPVVLGGCGAGGDQPSKGRVGDDTSRIQHINADMLPRWESSISDRCHLFNVALLLSMTPFATAQRKEATANPPSSRAG
jgi:hypothetical protein